MLLYFQFINIKKHKELTLGGKRIMKKRNMVIIVLIIALLLMGSAYAAWTDTVSVTVNAESATLNVKIVDREAPVLTTASGSSYQHSTVGASVPAAATFPLAAGTETVTEQITDMVPGETVTFEYRIENLGTLDVDLTGIDITHTTTDLPLTVNWTIEQFGASGGSDTGTGNDTTFTNIDLLGSGSDYCVLTVVVAIDDPSGNLAAYETAQTGEFTVELEYTQK